MSLELQNTPPSRFTAEVVSASQTQLVLRLPDWSDALVLLIHKDSGQWPHKSVPSPAVNVRYVCEVDLNGEVPKIAKWYSHPEAGEHRPTPLVPPCGIPSPPDLLPVHDPSALSRVIASLGKVSPQQREGIAYLIRRAHGQGMRS